MIDRNRSVLGLVLLVALARMCSAEEARSSTTPDSTPSPAVTTASHQVGIDISGEVVTLDGEKYQLKSNTSNPKEATSELREYLRAGEDWDGYRKMVSFRMMKFNDPKVDAATFARQTLATTVAHYPGAYTREVFIEPDHAVILYVITSGANAEYNLWDLRRTRNGIPAVQIVLRNKPPYESAEKFKAEYSSAYERWLVQIGVLSSHCEEALALTAKKAGGH
jgi:hypothetical protein